ncbi:sarcosine oxidase [Melghirimyces profundicolus]|uniref:Sarcosine oxidase n=1 Tax=Melghirimyces profundicolus TaxID=1242148 RepID=A0A2T6B167_9BACL|nr:N-methyl-L-tryptophan oxidase [Melghirimyces profundicolus]PTX49811.1 sarcosine oxidase [Melghirimyces profundicolus]
MNAVYDVIVAGLGGIGSAAAYHLAKRGERVLGVDRFHPPHSLGSSHGHTRIFRQAYLEGSSYVPLAQKSCELWKRLERETGKDVFAPVGGLMIGPPDCPIVKSTVLSAERYGLPYQMLTAADTARRFPAYLLQRDEVAVYEEAAGVLFPESCIQAHLTAAVRHGSEIQTRNPVLQWTARNGGVTVHTEKGVYQAERLVLSAGAWNPQLFGFTVPLEVERKVPAWFQPAESPRMFEPGRFPAFVWHCTKELNIYGLPGFNGEGTKVGVHQGGLKGAPDDLPRQASLAEVEELRRLVARRFPLLNQTPVTVDTCLYTNTPDGHFVLGPHPGYQNVFVAGGFSGHGFKFCSILGEIIADLAIESQTDFDIRMFSPTRF